VPEIPSGRVVRDAISFSLEIVHRSANNNSMSEAPAKRVVLVFALVLALPPHWCCVLPLKAAQTTVGQSSAASCCHDTNEPSQATCCCSSKPRPAAPPAQPVPFVEACGCAIPLSTPPAGVAPSPPEAAALIVFADINGSITSGVVHQQLEEFSPPPDCSLHLFQCVWRC
jgi:hypothetical protein